MRFVWDERKNKSNQRKHGISFETATAIFEDTLQLLIEDRVVEGEQRWKTIGQVHGRYLLIAVHTFEEDGEDLIRIISAREATAHERRDYEDEI